MGRPRLNPRLSRVWAALERRPLAEFMERVPERRLASKDTFEAAVREVDAYAPAFLCVLDEQGCLDGIVSRNELFEAFAQGKDPAAEVRDFMRTDPIVVTPADTSLTVGDLMNREDVDWVLVIENKQTRRLLGVILSEKLLHRLLPHVPG